MIYLADSLELLHHKFYHYFTDELRNHSINFKIISETCDVWLRDFMPVKSQTDFIWFNYFPSYLNTKKYRPTITKHHQIQFTFEYPVRLSELNIDGGNCEYGNNSILLTDRIYNDNKTKNKLAILHEIESLFQTDKIFILPAVPHDFTGHIDGLARWLDDRTILISDFNKEKTYYQDKLRKAIKSQKLTIELMPNATHLNNNLDSAKGCYLNFIETANQIIFPIFGIDKDDSAINKITSYFPNKDIIPVNCNEIAEFGGLLHCISWQD